MLALPKSKRQIHCQLPRSTSRDRMRLAIFHVPHRGLIPMRICTSLILIAALLAYEFSAAQCVCRCTVCDGECKCSPTSAAVEASSCSCCCPERHPVAQSQIDNRSCNCGKQPNMSFTADQFPRRFPEDTPAVALPVTVEDQWAGLPFQALAAVSAAPYLSRSLQEVYCIWRE
jgi:hypothetical protein